MMKYLASLAGLIRFYW